MIYSPRPWPRKRATTKLVAYCTWASLGLDVILTVIISIHQSKLSHARAAGSTPPPLPLLHTVSPAITRALLQLPQTQSWSPCSMNILAFCVHTYMLAKLNAQTGFVLKFYFVVGLQPVEAKTLSVRFRCIQRLFTIRNRSGKQRPGPFNPRGVHFRLEGAALARRINLQQCNRSAS